MNLNSKVKKPMSVKIRDYSTDAFYIFNFIERDERVVYFKNY